MNTVSEELYNEKVDLLTEDKLPKKTYIIGDEEITTYICPEIITYQGGILAGFFWVDESNQYIIISEEIFNLKEEEQKCIISHEVGHMKDPYFERHYDESQESIEGYLLAEAWGDAYTIQIYGKELSIKVLKNILERDDISSNENTKNLIELRIQMIEEVL